MLKQYIPKPKPPFPYDRPLSWSQISAFKYRPSQWYRKYVLGIEDPPSKEMIFGKEEGEKFASAPSYMPELPRLPIYEHELKFTIGDIQMIGYIDNYEKGTAIAEFKTGRKKWDAKRVKDHGQITLYMLGLWATEQVRPESIDSHLYWLPTHIKDGEIAYIEPLKVHKFKAKRTMTDILKFANEIKEIRKQMIEYYDKQLA